MTPGLARPSWAAATAFTCVAVVKEAYGHLSVWLLNPCPLGVCLQWCLPPGKQHAGVAEVCRTIATGPSKGPKIAASARCAKRRRITWTTPLTETLDEGFAKTFRRAALRFKRCASRKANAMNMQS
jgi:hypothetical protein